MRHTLTQSVGSDGVYVSTAHCGTHRQVLGAVQVNSQDGCRGRICSFAGDIPVPLDNLSKYSVLDKRRGGGGD